MLSGFNAARKFVGMKPFHDKKSDPEFGPVMKVYRKGQGGRTPQKRLQKLLEYSRNQIFGSLQSYVILLDYKINILLSYCMFMQLLLRYYVCILL